MGLCVMQRNTAIHDGDKRVPPAKQFAEKGTNLVISVISTNEDSMPAHESINAAYPGLTPRAKLSFALAGSIHERRTSSVCAVSASAS
jgi:hypothetical protein